MEKAISKFQIVSALCIALFGIITAIRCMMNNLPILVIAMFVLMAIFGLLLLKEFIKEDKNGNHK